MIEKRKKKEGNKQTVNVIYTLLLPPLSSPLHPHLSCLIKCYRKNLLQKKREENWLPCHSWNCGRAFLNKQEFYIKNGAKRKSGIVFVQINIICNRVTVCMCGVCLRPTCIPFAGKSTAISTKNQYQPLQNTFG